MHFSSPHKNRNKLQSISALSLAPEVNNWLANSCQPRVLHVFDPACNLINERKEVLSIVAPQIGNGPFNLVVEDNVVFSEHLGLESHISVSPTHLTLGNLTIHTAIAELWNPCPDWEELHRQRDMILGQLTKLPITNYPVRGLEMGFATIAHQPYPTTTNLQSLISNLCSALANADVLCAQTMTSKLAGLGQGLTPAGDDFIMGAILAVWIIHPLDVASILAEEITKPAALLTTSLSAAWLKSVGKGEAGILWHEFLDACIVGEESNIKKRVGKILTIGETSGADVLAGFLNTMQSYIALSSRQEITSARE